MTITAELKGVTKTYGNKKVLDDINLQIRAGETLALLGPNGSGKTTLLKILAFIENPSSGEVKFQGETVNFKNTEKNRMGSTLVFQRTVLFNTSVYNNIAFGLRVRKMPKNMRDEEIRNVLKLVKLEGFEKRPARKLSGGEQQRVAIARALVLKTALLLLDEPTANLDPRNASLLEEVIATVNRKMRTTIVMATHNMFQAKTLPDRIALMSDGKITEVGTPAEIFGTLSKNLASFAAVDNTFTGTAKTTSEGTTVVDIGSGVQIEAAAKRQGVISIFVNPQDIIVSNNTVSSSARNVLKGKVTEIHDLDSVVRLKVKAGKDFTVQVTRKSFNEMHLTLDSNVYLVFKASAVQIV